MLTLVFLLVIAMHIVIIISERKKETHLSNLNLSTNLSVSNCAIETFFCHWKQVSHTLVIGND